MAKPFISVITIAYNCEESIERTIKSVLSQIHPNYEYIIVDGGSVDGTMDMVKKYKEGIHKIISEPDRGISHAFNKGIALSSGEYINMLNAGDVFIHHKVLSLVQEQKESEIISFRTQSREGYLSAWIDSHSPKLKKALLSHQSAFVKKSLHERIGGYSESFKLRMDYDFFLRSIDKAATFTFSADPVVIYDAGVSGSIANRLRFLMEGWFAEYLNLGRNGWFIFRPLIILHEVQKYSFVVKYWDPVKQKIKRLLKK